MNTEPAALEYRQKKKRVTFNAMIAPETFAFIAERAKQQGISRGKVIDVAIATLVDLCEQQD